MNSSDFRSGSYPHLCCCYSCCIIDIRPPPHLTKEESPAHSHIASQCFPYHPAICPVHTQGKRVGAISSSQGRAVCVCVVVVLVGCLSRCRRSLPLALRRANSNSLAFCNRQSLYWLDVSLYGGSAPVHPPPQVAGGGRPAPGVWVWCPPINIAPIKTERSSLPWQSTKGLILLRVTNFINAEGF